MEMKESHSLRFICCILRRDELSQPNSSEITSRVNAHYVTLEQITKAINNGKQHLSSVGFLLRNELSFHACMV